MSEGKFIDVTPTWRAVLPLLIEAAVRGTTSEARANAMMELQRMADMADAMVKQVKANKENDDE